MEYLILNSVYNNFLMITPEHFSNNVLFTIFFISSNRSQVLYKIPVLKNFAKFFETLAEPIFKKIVNVSIEIVSNFL